MDTPEKETHPLRGILTISDEEFNSLTRQIQEHILKNGYKNDNQEFKFDGKKCICNIKITKSPSWISSMLWIHKTKKNLRSKDGPKNTTKHVIKFFRYSSGLIYFERNGSIRLDKILEKYTFNCIDQQEWNKVNKNEFEDTLESYIKSTAIDDSISKLDEKIKAKSKLEFESRLSFYLRMYDEILYLPESKQLPNYNSAECLDENRKSSETKYNKLVCQNNTKYILLDRKTINTCEIADIYDPENHLLFHNKKDGDLRILVFQIINGITILEDELERQKFIKNLTGNPLYMKKFHML